MYFRLGTVIKNILLDGLKRFHGAKPKTPSKVTAVDISKLYNVKHMWLMSFDRRFK